jgi:hypothetical protein
MYIEWMGNVSEKLNADKLIYIESNLKGFK